MTPPRELVRALAEYDPLLRCRWGHRTELWIIEKKLPERHRQLLAERPNPWHSARGLDLYDGWIAGYVHVLNVHPSLIANVALVMEHLTEADLWRQGGVAALTRKLDEWDEQAEQAANRDIQNFSEAAARDAYDRIAWLQGNRVAVTTPGRPEVVIEREGYLVRDRRVTV